MHREVHREVHRVVLQMVRPAADNRGMPLDFFAPAQCVGYIAFVLGVASFLQTNDRRFKVYMTAECAAYVAHFAMLGNPTAVASSLVSMVRSWLSMHTASPWVAAAVVAVNIALGSWLAEKPSDWLPLVASCLGTLALFLLKGIAMRAVMLVGTACWITNNILVGSIGGTALELVVAAVNLSTIWRMWRQQQSAASA